MRAKKVAVIGLVTAKTLLHDSSCGASTTTTYHPVIFDTRQKVGGLWAVSSAQSRDHDDLEDDGQGTPSHVTLDPNMKTNLSRFSVAFSDLSWQSALGGTDLPMFPRAREVGQYLAVYAERYIPGSCLRLESRVIRTERLVGEDGKFFWRVYWIDETRGKQEVRQGTESVHNNQVKVEDFDLIVVASGYFARPWIPNLPGLSSFTGQVLHSSALGRTLGKQCHVTNPSTRRGHTLVIGGSMSGVEAASTLALRQSASRLSGDALASGDSHIGPRIYHVHSRPFWTLPLCLPHERSTGTSAFLPLDLAMYDLNRRPPGPVEYTIGSLTEEKIAKTSDYFRTILGTEYERFGHSPPTPSSSFPQNIAASATKQTPSQPEWVAIGNDYAEFVRSGDVEPIHGRVTSIDTTELETGTASVRIETGNGPNVLNNITLIITATGFTPFDSISFLPAEVLSSLEMDKNDPCLPLILDGGGTLRSEIPDLGFVGFYRGPYWGVMEMQARYLARVWAAEGTASEYGAFQLQTSHEQEKLRNLRNPHGQVRRAQFPMGDYVGLMEQFARHLKMKRISPRLGDEVFSAGPVVPARYVVGTPGSETRRTLDDLCAILQHDHPATQAATALAVFRALQGTWSVVTSTGMESDTETETQTQIANRPSKIGSDESSETMTFIPQSPSHPLYDREYLLRRWPNTIATRRGAVPDPMRDGTILRLSETSTIAPSNSHVEICRGRPSQTTIDEDEPHAWRLELGPLNHGEKDGEYVVRGQIVPFPGVDRLNPMLLGTPGECEWTFFFHGVSITRWEYRLRRNPQCT
ncbi:hypothetical protein PDE_00774 [Penicillium oxalicum 114-2]|uniref:FAD/NAD(P)-binding domain-containing protein n=1 Tax=Penicillium oxalicum (strain 114-2 / CGMCC 5302) TaxID=933388 RepID=S8AJC2_PENO1|nr:hypothetical protein PDE_00774 [Penicillium oxalicum 114-2]